VIGVSQKASSRRARAPIAARSLAISRKLAGVNTQAWQSPYSSCVAYQSKALPADVTGLESVNESAAAVPVPWRPSKVQKLAMKSKATPGVWRVRFS
jgi:hypothetical protein